MKILILLLTLILFSCTSQNQFNNNKTENNMESPNDGFTKMTFVESKNTSCEFLLQDIENNLYEVQDIASKIQKITAGKKIEIKYTLLRKMSVCGAQPIMIDEIRLEK